MPADKNGRSAAQTTLDVLRAAGNVIGRMGALGNRRVQEQALQQVLQLNVWEDEGGAAACPKVMDPRRAC